MRDTSLQEKFKSKLRTADSVDVTLAAARSAAVVIAQVNSMMPRIPGEGFIHLDDVSVILEQEEELLTAFDLPSYESASEIADIAANLIDDGATIQLGLAELSQPIARALASKMDLGVHTEILTDDLMELVSQGVVTNRHKKLNEGKVIASGAIGSQDLHRSLNDNVAIEFKPSDYVNNPAIIAQNHKMVAIGFEKIIGMGVYAHENSAVAEVAFSTSKDWQGKGIGSRLLRKLAEAARENGFLSLVAEVLPTNSAMIKLFKKLPYQINTKTEFGSLILSCNLDEEK
jgi:acyl-CoA hydrolase